MKIEVLDCLIEELTKLLIKEHMEHRGNERYIRIKAIDLYSLCIKIAKLTKEVYYE